MDESGDEKARVGGEKAAADRHRRGGQTCCRDPPEEEHRKERDLDRRIREIAQLSWMKCRTLS